MKEKLVSVIISVFNRKELMKKTLDAMLKSDYKNYEVVAVDGGSADGTLEMLEEYSKKNKKVRTFLDRTPGRNAARNTGISNAKGEILIFVDSDCVVRRNWMKEITKPFSDGKIGGVIGRTIADKKGVFWYHMENDYLQFIGHNSAYRKSVIKKIRGFDPRFKTAKEDTDLAWRVIESGYDVVYCKNAVMTHLSKKVGIKYRIKNQRTYVYDGLLLRKHGDLYRKYFYDKGMPAPLWPSILSPFLLLAFAYFLVFYRIIAVAAIIIYVIIVGSKLARENDGSLKDKTAFILLSWMLPLSRFYNFCYGYIKFRKSRISH
jgi:glycosyltransferase involved in cell wall biosynthesis